MNKDEPFVVGGSAVSQASGNNRLASQDPVSGTILPPLVRAVNCCFWTGAHWLASRLKGLLRSSSGVLDYSAWTNSLRLGTDGIMSKKNKQNRGRRVDIDHLQIARRELVKRNAKLALKHARLQHDQSPNGESRDILERVLLARAEQLHEHGNHDAAKVLIDELSGLGITVAEVSTSLDRLRVLMGIPAEQVGTTVGSPGDPPEELAALLADRAVLYPQKRSPAYAELNAQADIVRAALGDVERGEETAAVNRLAGIPRKSPFAEWRLFVRGLVAHYADDAQRVDANWRRLDPQRAACRIANHLQVFTGRRKAADCPGDMATGQRRLQYAVSDSPLVERLERIRDCFQSGRIHQACPELRTLRQRFGQSRKRLLERLSDLMWKRLVAQGDERGLRQLTGAVPGPPLDPHWHRARAVLWYQTESTDLNQIEDLWTAYVRDLQQCEILSADERKIAVSLVLARLAKLFGEAASDEASQEESGFDVWDDDDEYEGTREQCVELLRKQAEKHLRSALREYPQLLRAHRDLVKLYQDDDQPEKAVEAARRLLEHFPDHFDTLLWLANYFIEADQPADAEPYANRASGLRPRDSAVQTLLWHQRMGMLRQVTRKRKFDLAQTQLEEAFAAPPASVKPYTKDLLQATIQYKAKNNEAAETHLQAALGQVREPTAIWLMMHAYADRFGLPREVKNDFRDRFKAAIQKRLDSQTAGHIAGFLRDFVVRRVKYTGLATHQRLYVERLQRFKKVDWQLQDLRDVCEFLQSHDSYHTQGLRLRLLSEGLRRFPSDPLFPYLYALNRMHAGPYRTDYGDVVEHLERALELNKTAKLRLSDAALEDAKQSLAAAQVARDMFSSMMERLSELMGSDFDMGADDWDDDDDDWDDEEDYEDDYGPSYGRAGSPQGKQSDSGRRQRFFPFF